MHCNKYEQKGPCLLFEVLELDVMDVRIVEERSYTAAIEMGSGSGSGESCSAHTQRKHFLYFTDDKIFSVLMEICRTLGIYAFASTFWKIILIILRCNPYAELYNCVQCI